MNVFIFYLTTILVAQTIVCRVVDGMIDEQ
jgi:hypothetical protein